MNSICKLVFDIWRMFSDKVDLVNLEKYSHLRDYPSGSSTSTLNLSTHLRQIWICVIFERERERERKKCWSGIRILANIYRETTIAVTVRRAFYVLTNSILNQLYDVRASITTSVQTKRLEHSPRSQNWEVAEPDFKCR